MGACGAVNPHITKHSLVSESIGETTEEALQQQWIPRIASEMLPKLPSSPGEVGFWFGRIGGRAVALIVYSETQGQTPPFSLSPDESGMVTVEGRIAETVGHFAGYINQGAFGFASCKVDPALKPPQFRMSCPMMSEDRTAWVQLVYSKPKRMLASPFLSFLARRSSHETFRFSEPASSLASASTDSRTFTQATLKELNLVRAQAQLPPVQLAEEQSFVSGLVSGHYLSAAMEPGHEVEQEKIALGLLAGWQVKGMIRSAEFFWSLLPYTQDHGSWVANALATPLGRSTLLAPDIKQIALGPMLLSEPKAVSAVVTGYRLHEGSDHSQDVQTLMQRLGEARQSRRLSALLQLESLRPDLQAELARVHAGQIQPEEALQNVMERGAAQLGQPIRGYLVETTSVQSLELPDAIVHRPGLSLILGVTHRKPSGAAWAQLVVLVVYLDVQSRDA